MQAVAPGAYPPVEFIAEYRAREHDQAIDHRLQAPEALAQRPRDLLDLRAEGQVAIVGNGCYGVTVNAQPGFMGAGQKNNFVGSRDACAFSNLSGTSTLVVTNDYWGAATGPGPDPADQVCADLGTSTVVPFATKPFGVQARVKP